MKDLSPQEKIIMQIVWKHCDNYLSAREIETELFLVDNKERNVASLMAMLAKLVDKGYLNPVKKFRKSTYYVPVITELEYKAYFTKQFIDGTHNGDFSSLISAFVNNEEYTERDLEKLRNMLKNLKRK